MPCDLNELKVAATCFMSKCMGDGTRESIDLYIMLAFLAAHGGTDYTSNINILEADASQWERLAKSEREAIITYLNIQSAEAFGVVFEGGSSAENLTDLSKCIQCLGSEQRKCLIAFVGCQIAAILNEQDIFVIGGEGGGVIGGEGGGEIGAE